MGEACSSSNNDFNASPPERILADGLRREQVSKLWKQAVFLLPGGVHHAADVRCLLSGMEPTGHVIQIVRVIVTGHERAITLVRDEPQALFPRGTTPNRNDEIFGHMLPRTREVAVDKVILAKGIMIGVEHIGPHVDLHTGYVTAMANELAVRMPTVIAAAAPFYSRQPASENVPQIKASLLLHYAELDKRVNAGWPAYEKALKSAGVDFKAHIYPNVNHGFHNDTTPRYDEAAAKLAWRRTIDFFNANLR